MDSRQTPGSATEIQVAGLTRHSKSCDPPEPYTLAKTPVSEFQILFSKPPSLLGMGPTCLR